MGSDMQTMCPWMTQSDVQHMQKNPMMGWYAHMGQTRVYPDSPISIVALHDEVGLYHDPVKQLTRYTAATAVVLFLSTTAQTTHTKAAISCQSMVRIALDSEDADGDLVD